jgi:hypothetical protein
VGKPSDQFLFLKTPEAFSFDWLRKGKLGLTKAYGCFLVEAASFCLHLNQHPNPVFVIITGTDTSTSVSLEWDEITDRHKYSFADEQEAAEYGAYGVAAIIVLKLTGIPHIARSAKGTGVDFWLGLGTDDRGIFQSTARLEVSGILRGSDGRIAARRNTKLSQTTRSDATSLPVYIAIVEFGRPEIRVAKRLGEEPTHEETLS